MLVQTHYVCYLPEEYVDRCSDESVTENQSSDCEQNVHRYFLCEITRGRVGSPCTHLTADKQEISLNFSDVTLPNFKVQP